MMLNRKARRAKKNRRPFASDNPADQMKAFLKQPGKFHIVQLPDQKSFVVKVTEAEMPLFLTICQQLRGVLGHCEAIPATPVDASVANTQMIAEDSAQASKRIRQARARQDEADANPPTLHVVREKSELITTDPVADTEAAARERHPAGKGRPASGRHRAPEPETTFDKLAAGNAVDIETRRRLAAIEIAAAQAEAGRAQDALEVANERLREAYDNGGELHNRAVLDKFAEQAGQAIAENADVQPLCEHKTVHAPGPDGPFICNQCGGEVTRISDSSEIPNSSRHRCEQPAGAALGGKWRCWCGQAWEAETSGWKRWPERPEQRQNRLIDNAIDIARQDAINDALRQAGAEAPPQRPPVTYDRGGD